MLTKIVLAAAAFAASAAAQSGTVAGGACTVSNTHRSDDGMADLYLICGEAAYPIGTGAQFSAAYNATAKAFVVVLQNPGRTDVRLVAVGADGAPRIDDLSRTLAKAAVKAGMPATPPYDIDVTAFAASGTIALGSGTMKTSDANRVLLDLTPYASNVGSLQAK